MNDFGDKIKQNLILSEQSHCFLYMCVCVTVGVCAYVWLIVCVMRGNKHYGCNGTVSRQLRATLPSLWWMETQHMLPQLNLSFLCLYCAVPWNLPPPFSGFLFLYSMHLCEHTSVFDAVQARGVCGTHQNPVLSASWLIDVQSKHCSFACVSLEGEI